MNRFTTDSNSLAVTFKCETGSARWIEACWNDMRDRAQAGEAYDADRYISMIPDASAEQIADLVYGEFVTSRERGITVSAEHYLARYPKISDQLARQFTIDDALSLINAEEPCARQDTIEETHVFSPPVVADRDQPSAESKIGRYVIFDKLQQGAQAEVYRAYDPTLKRDVVIKIERECEPKHQRLFSDVEAVITANLNHPNIAPALDAGEHHGRKYSVSRFIRGRTFDQWVRDSNPSSQLVAKTLAKVARGLAHAHENAVLHLDVKPRNIVVDENQEPYLIDFGLSVSCDAFSEHVMDEGSVRGTLQFMAPEQLKSDVNQIGPCSDIFGLGATLFSGWVGRAPYDAPRNRDDLRRIERCEWHAEWLDETALSDDMKSIVSRALAASPGQRYSNCNDFAAELESVSKIDPLEKVDDLALLTSKRGVLWSRMLLGAAALILIFGFASWLPTDSTKDGHSVLSVSHAALELVVAIDDDRFVDLANRVPLDSGDKLRLKGLIPANRAAKVIAFSPDGNCRVIVHFEKQDEDREFQHPSDPGKAIPLVGPGGTEVVALVTADSADVLDRVMTQLEQLPTTWELIPEAIVLVWRNDQFMSLQPTTADIGSLEKRLAGNTRDLGGAVDINPALTKISDQFKKLAASLDREGVEIDAVAFRHLSSELRDSLDECTGRAGLKH